MDFSLYTKAYNQIKNSNNILLVTHERPDGDAIASVCAMAEILEILDKKYLIYCYNKINGQFDFLPHIEKFKTNYGNFDFDLIIVIDCGSLNRTKLEKEIKNRKQNQFIIEIDHHPKVDDYADLEIKDPEISSTSELIYYLVKANKIKINKDLANCLLTGILADTSNFLYPSTSSETITIASDLLLKGARMPQIVENTWRNKSIDFMKTWGRALSNLYINPKYKFAVSVLTKDDIGSSEEIEENMTAITNFLGNLGDVYGILLLREQKDGSLKGSLRSAHPEIDVSRIAKIFGGGGHAKSSGFEIKGKLEKTERGWKVI